MIWLHHIIIVSILSLLHCRSTLAQEQQPLFETNIAPNDVEGGTLEVPLGQLRQIEFTVTYIPRGVEYHAGVQRNKRQLNINNNDFESQRLLSVVRRGCEDSNRPGERCLLLQVTMNGTNEHISRLNGSTFNFVVFGDDLLNPEYTSDTITLRLVDPPTTKEEVPITTSTKPETTTEVPGTTTNNNIVVNSNARMDECKPIIVETIVPWVFVAVLAALLFLTIIILILVICNYRNRQGKSDVESPLESNNSLNNVPSAPLPPSETGGRSSISKDSNSDSETTSQHCL